MSECYLIDFLRDDLKLSDLYQLSDKQLESLKELLHHWEILTGKIIKDRLDHSPAGICKRLAGRSDIPTEVRACISQVADMVEIQQQVIDQMKGKIKTQ